MTEPADLLLTKLEGARDDCMDHAALEAWPVLARGILAKALQDAIEAGADAAWERWAGAVEVAMDALQDIRSRPFATDHPDVAAVAMVQIREKAAAPPMIPVQVKPDGVWLDFGKGGEIRLMDLLAGSGMDVWEKLNTYQRELIDERARRKARREADQESNDG